MSLLQARQSVQQRPMVLMYRLCMQAADDPSPGSEEDEDGLASPGPCARGAEVLVSSTAGPDSGTGAALTRHRALAKLAFLVEAPHGVIPCMLGQVSQDIKAPHMS